MAVFPTDPLPVYDYTLTPRWDTMVKRTRGGKEQRRAKLTYAQYDVTLRFYGNTKAEFTDLWEFYMARQGAYGAFWFYDLYSQAHEGLYVGTGDGSEDTFDLPGKTTSSQTIYVDGSEQTLTTDYTISSGTGDGSADQVVFEAGSVPASGEIITCDLTGYLRARVRFEDDEMDRVNFEVALFETGIKLRGLAPE